MASEAVLGLTPAGCEEPGHSRCVAGDARAVRPLGEERCRSYMELIELIELAEMPPEYMAWA